MTIVLTRSLLRSNVTDALGRRVHVGDRIVDLRTNSVAIVIGHCDDLGPDCLQIQLCDEENLGMTYWVSPEVLVALPRLAMAG